MPSFIKIPTLITRDNNFDFLRLVAAFLVFFGHSIIITQTSKILDTGIGVTIGVVGVNIFFVISGFLITKSRIESRDTLLFIKKRILRIYPALIFAILFTIFIIGPFTTFFSFNYYFHSLITADYFKNIFLFRLMDLNTNVLPGVFVTNKLPFIVNASLWTIPIEAGCYLLVILFGFSKLLSNKLAVLYVLLGLLVYSTALTVNKDFQSYFQNYFNFPFLDIVRLLTYFFSGMVIYLYRESIRIPKKYFYYLLLIFFVSIMMGYFELISYFLLPMLVIVTALATFDFPKKITRWGDFSYGFYLFAFPIQQTVSYFFHNKLSLFQHMAISFFPILLLAILSWFLIEKPFLKFKKETS